MKSNTALLVVAAGAAVLLLGRIGKETPGVPEPTPEPAPVPTPEPTPAPTPAPPGTPEPTPVVSWSISKPVLIPKDARPASKVELLTLVTNTGTAIGTPQLKILLGSKLIIDDAGEPVGPGSGITYKIEFIAPSSVGSYNLILSVGEESITVPFEVSELGGWPGANFSATAKKFYPEHSLIAVTCRGVKSRSKLYPVKLLLDGNIVDTQELTPEDSDVIDMPGVSWHVGILKSPPLPVGNHEWRVEDQSGIIEISDKPRSDIVYESGYYKGRRRLPDNFPVIVKSAEVSDLTVSAWRGRPLIYKRRDVSGKLRLVLQVSDSISTIEFPSNNGVFYHDILDRFQLLAGISRSPGVASTLHFEAPGEYVIETMLKGEPSIWTGNYKIEVKIQFTTGFYAAGSDLNNKINMSGFVFTFPLGSIEVP